eukprot:CAMPEP_0185768554 /NCGR_PEP_ID=MMETSP1174-20130828/50436_1 /TAXON_ID=35687 /ORGANISM="Dictyocha speculum, Strain CCMP1381" /LENGTH=65 /DNA_ID=CAMNT_0028453287 /DNA_START=45 /DNA_END=242 /DNA_ORIENTATION=+
MQIRRIQREASMLEVRLHGQRHVLQAAEDNVAALDAELRRAIQDKEAACSKFEAFIFERLQETLR